VTGHDIERLRRQVSVSETGCWLWQGRVHPRTGYGQAWFDGTNRLAHRVMFTLVRGPIPAGLQLDHLCRVRHCVNPEHLEPVTARENTLRGVTLPAANAAKTECPRGHLYDTDNTYVDRRGGRHCRACKAARQASPEGRAYWRRWYAANRQGVAS